MSFKLFYFWCTCLQACVGVDACMCLYVLMYVSIHVLVGAYGRDQRTSLSTVLLNFETRFLIIQKHTH